MIKYLIEKGININKHVFGHNSLYWCRDYPETLKILIKNGIDIHQIDNNGHNALFWCRNHPEILKMLLDKGI